MKAMVFRASSNHQNAWLEEADVPALAPGDGELLVKVDKCGVCRTDLHVVEQDLPPLLPAVIPGHEIVGRVEEIGRNVRAFVEGDRIGVPWLHHTDGRCEHCLAGRENLCDNKVFTGYSVNGGYSEHVLAEEGYSFHLPAGDSAKQAPLLCAGIIGYRALKLALPRPGGRIGFFGFGGSAHLALQLASKLGFETVAYSRSQSHLELARALGASESILTTGAQTDPRPPTLDGAVVFAPVGEVVVQALRELKKGGTLSIAAIHLSPIPTIDYDRFLFGERKIVSVEANTRADAKEFLQLAERLRLESSVSLRPLSAANDALSDLRAGKVAGALVLDCAREN
jgi:alcohol dehydrogenase, propanol-preferring